MLHHFLIFKQKNRKNLLKIPYFITINILKLKTQNTIIRTDSNFNCGKRVIIIR